MSMVDCREIEEIHFVDDSSDEIMITRMLLKKDKIAAELKSYYSFDDFLAFLGSQTDDTFKSWIAVIDINLGVSSGIEAVRTIRSKPQYDDLIVGICTGSDDPKDQCDAFEAGADFFANKPFRGSVVEKICTAVSGLSLKASPGEPIRVLRAVS